MISGHDELNETTMAEYRSHWDEVERVRALHLASMTEHRALEIIQSLGASESWRERPDWSGLVEQQAVFLRGILP
jgi:hypothetical protein